MLLYWCVVQVIVHKVRRLSIKLLGRTSIMTLGGVKGPHF